jgi:predicted NodU family carbamoyl transferase
MRIFDELRGSKLRPHELRVTICLKSFPESQSIRQQTNPLFAGILRRFSDATGLPVLINTSFNVHEEPIVNRPSECLRALLDARVDFVVTNEARGSDGADTFARALLVRLLFS